MKTKAFSYLRVSGKGQIDGDGFPRQRETITRYAKRHQVEIVREFRDEGVSGTKDAFDRDGLTDLLVALKANGVRLVLIERADRLARDLMISEILLGEFRKFGVKVIASDSDTDLTVEDGDATRTLMRQMLGAIAQWEKSVIVQKLRAARMRIRKTEGRCEGRKPYGLTEQEKAVISSMEELKRSGKSIAAIAKHLNSAGIKPRLKKRAGKDVKWHPTTVQRILARLTF
jgi:DNA invertase Pin-like site-specific DNA recombinase